MICYMETYVARMERNGRIVIPAPIRRALGIEPGEDVVVTLVDNQVQLTARKDAVARAQAVVRQRTAGDSLVTELIKDRRAEAGTGAR